MSLTQLLEHSRSSLHRCLKRHGCSVLPKQQTSPSADKKNSSRILWDIFL